MRGNQRLWTWFEDNVYLLWGIGGGPRLRARCILQPTERHPPVRPRLRHGHANKRVHASTTLSSCTIPRDGVAVVVQEDKISEDKISEDNISARSYL
jgi:hypothetical protein